MFTYNKHMVIMFTTIPKQCSDPFKHFVPGASRPIPPWDAVATASCDLGFYKNKKVRLKKL